MKKNTKIIIALVVLAALIAGALLLHDAYMPKGVAGGKNITVEVIHSDGSTAGFDIATDSENLRGALEERNLIEGTESSYGLYVTVVDGEAADDTLQQWWCFTKSGEMLPTGVDDTMIQDGDRYEITFTTGW